MGVDTVKLSYRFGDVDRAFSCGPFVCTRRGRSTPWRHFSQGGWTKTGKRGTVGPVWYQEYFHEFFDLRVVVKGCSDQVYLLWEGSVPKHLGVLGACHPDMVRLVDEQLRSCWPRLGRPVITRCDVTEDFHDPDKSLLTAAVDWNPHERSRYTQSIHEDRASGGVTVWQHNKTRGVRVYDKGAESGEQWAEGLVRVEYQVRGDWLGRYGLDRLYSDFARNCGRALGPVTESLLQRLEKN